jgi:hypothetical protein
MISLVVTHLNINAVAQSKLMDLNNLVRFSCFCVNLCFLSLKILFFFLLVANLHNSLVTKWT